MAEEKKKGCCCGSGDTATANDKAVAEGIGSADGAAVETYVPDCCSHKTKERSEKEYKDLLNRLSRIEGQVRGVRRMLEENAYCTDIMTQVAAVNAALNSFNKVLMTNHMKTCVTRDIKEGKEETLDDLIRTLQKLMK